MKQLLATAALGLLLSACQVVGPDYSLPDKAAINRGDLQGHIAGEGNNVVSAPCGRLVEVVQRPAPG